MQHKIKLAFWIMVIVSIIAFGALVALLKTTMGNINQDPSLVNLTNDSVFRIIQIVNKNKNLNSADCWNQKNPYILCSDSNKIEPGTYTIHGGNDAIWLEGPYENLFNKDIFKLNEDYVRRVLGGFMLTNQTYFQKVIISYGNSPDTMNIIVETQNDDKQSYSQSLTLNK